MKEDKEIEDPLDEWQTETKFRAVAARLSYLAHDRSDLQYASNCVSKHMSKPSPRGWRILKRVGRYLKGNERLVQGSPWAEKAVGIDAYGDSDWAGDRQSGKSTSGGVIPIRGTCGKDVVLNTTNHSNEFRGSRIVRSNEGRDTDCRNH